MADVGGNYRKLVERIDEAAAKSGREASAIKLLAAAKSQSIEAIRAALAAGVTLIGENYVQEAGEKKSEISTLVEWHMIGHLQRNKVRLAVELFDVIESLDNLALARELDKEGRRRGQIIRAFVEINLGGEESKSGIAKNHVASLLESVAKLANLRVEGLMTVPPFRQDPGTSAAVFSRAARAEGKTQRVRLPQRRPKRAVDGHDARLPRRHRRRRDDRAHRHSALWPAQPDRMFIFTNLLFAVAQVLDYVLWAYVWILIGRIVISFVQADHNNPHCALSLQRDRAGVGAGARAFTGYRRRLRSLAGRCLDRYDIFTAFFGPLAL